MSDNILEHIPEAHKKKPPMVKRNIRMQVAVDTQLSELCEEFNVTRTALVHALISREWDNTFEEE